MDYADCVGRQYFYDLNRNRLLWGGERINLRISVLTSNTAKLSVTDDNEYRLHFRAISSLINCACEFIK